MVGRQKKKDEKVRREKKDSKVKTEKKRRRKRRGALVVKED